MEFIDVAKTGKDRALLAIHATTTLWLACLLVSFLDIGTYSFTIDNDLVKHDSGCAYFLGEAFTTKLNPLTKIIGDSTSGNGSTLRLLENGKELGPAHSLHDRVRKSGGGAYSHWGNTLYFSSSNCEDIRANSKTYVALGEAVSTPFLYNLAFLPLISTLILLSGKIRNSPRLAAASNELLGSSRLICSRWTQGLLLITLAFLAIGYLLSIWKSGETVSLSISGWFPVSDSNGYWKCANSLLEAGTFGNLSEWCQRRSIYQNMLAGLNWLGHRNMFGTLVVQCSVLCTAIVLLMPRLSRYSGLCGILLAASLIFIYAANNAFPLTLTANAGLIFGSAGLALLIGGADREKLSATLVGLALISVALNARAGAFFVLPALILWCFIFSPRFNNPRITVTVLAVIAAGAGFLLQWLLVSAVGGDASRSHGNFSYTLYGLATGGQGWSSVYNSHPELFITHPGDAARAQAIYELAFTEIKQNPLLLFEGFKKNLILFWNMGTYGYHYLGEFGILAKSMWWLAWVPIVKNYRSPFYSLLGLMSLGVVASATWLLMDGGSRVFAATSMVDVVQIVVGFSFVARLFNHWVVGAPGTDNKSLEQMVTSRKSWLSSNYFRKDFVFAAILFGLLLIPHLVQFTNEDSSPLSSSSCDNGELSVLTTLGKSGTTYIDILDDDAEGEFLVNSITRSKLLNGTPDTSWWKDDLDNFEGKTLALIQQQNTAESDFGWTHHVYSDLSFSKYFGKTIEICVDPFAKRTIFDAAFSKVTSIKTQDPTN